MSDHLIVSTADCSINPPRAASLASHDGESLRCIRVSTVQHYPRGLGHFYKVAIKHGYTIDALKYVQEGN